MLLAAARSGNVSEVEKLARIDPSSVLETNEQGWSAAHYAARNGKLEMLQCLFRLDPNVLGMRTRNETEETPAHKAALNANKDVQSTREMFAWMHNVDPLFLTVEDGMGRSTIKVLSDTLDRSETDTLAWLHPEAAPSLAIPGAFAGGAEVLAGGAVAEAAAEGADSVTGRGAEGETGVRFESIASPLDGAAAATAAGSVYAATRPGAARGAGLEADSVERVAVVASLARDGAAGCGTSNSGATPPASLPTPPFRQDEHLEHPPPHGGGQDDVEGDSSEREWRDAELREIQAALSEAFGAEASTQMMTAWKLNNSGDFFSVVQHSTEDGLPMDYGALAAQEKRFVDRLLRSNQTMNAEAMELAVGELRGTKWAHFDVYEVLALAGSRSDGDNVLVRATLRGYAARLAPTAGWDPVVLLAAARAAEVQGWSDELRHNLLALYVTLFQKQAEALMSQQDRAFLGSSFRKAGGSSLLSSPGSDAPSYAEGEWAKLRTTVRSPAMDKLMKMIGLQVVKIQAVAIGKKLLADQKLSAKQRVSTALNFCFMGNPGTGKTEVARLFGQMLHEIGVRKSPPPITERTGQQMVQDGAMKADADIANAMDGVLFIDEAHSLDPGSNKAEGKAIVTKLLKAAEDHRERITIILAGYQDEIEEKLYASDQGFSSRFRNVYFPDYTEAELKQIFVEMVRGKDWSFDPESPQLVDVVARRIARGRNTKGFANARSVRSTMERAIEAASLAEDRGVMLKIEDFLGARPDPEINPLQENLSPLQQALEDLRKMTGLEEETSGGESVKRAGTAVKPAIRKLIKTVQANYDAELRGEKVLQVSLNRLFLGSPGTGKTTVGEVYGRILKELGLLSNGSVVAKKSKEFIVGHEGGTEEATLAILKNAEGKVLVIDEAYGLDGSMYGKIALDIIVSKVMGSPGEDIAVLMLGYEREMLAMIRDGNPGLKRRFQPEDAFYFPDFKDEELNLILKAKLKKDELTMRPEVRSAFIKLLAEERRKPGFGNAGAVDNLLSRATQNMKARDLATRIFEVGDLGSSSREAGAGGDPLEELKSMFKTEKIREVLEQLQATIKYKKSQGKVYEVENFVFVGNPGTGKTVVARLMAKMLGKLGVLEGRTVELTSMAMQGEVVGQSQAIARAKIDEATGAVLFVDEAHKLHTNVFSREGATMLMTATLEDQHKGRTMIILAGYAAPMDAMLDLDPGMKSRFDQRLEFPDWSASDCVEFLNLQCKAEHLVLEAPAAQHILGALEVARLRKGWANARDAAKVFEKLQQALALRASSDAGVDTSTFTLSDAEHAMRNFLKMRPEAAVDATGFPELFGAVGGALATMATTQAAGPPLLCVNSVARVEEVVEQAQAQAQESQGGDDDLFAKLQLACVELGYDADQDSRRRLVAGLEAVVGGGAFPEDIIKHVQGKVGSDSGALNAMLRPQAGSLLANVREAVAVEEARLEEIKRLEREHQLEEAARKQKEHVAMQQKLMQIGACPAGFSWFRQSGGWRCTGGSHWVTNADLARYFSH